MNSTGRAFHIFSVGAVMPNFPKWAEWELQRHEKALSGNQYFFSLMHILKLASSRDRLRANNELNKDGEHEILMVLCRG
jgi:hypothetical protein